jgi:hypothetical protein
MLDLMGVETGVDLGALLEVSRRQVAAVVDHPLESSLRRADPSWVLHPAPERQQLQP